MPSPLRVYADGLVKPSSSPVTVKLSDGTEIPLALDRYLGPADATDQRLLRALNGPVLDVGCGPGRHLHALAKRGVFALGVDLSPVAVGLARDGGANAIVGSIFDELPGAGTWRTALLLDGNVGIGGAPARLLRRVGGLLTHNGDVVVELDPPSVETATLMARLETPNATSGWFNWARVAATDIDQLASAAGFSLRAQEQHSDRWFAWLQKH
jgi:SAM-dependent methyltransferase